jgi:hypothetical protein
MLHTDRKEGIVQMASLAELRSEARKLGIAPSVVRNASTARELRVIIEDFDSGNGSAKKSTAKKAVKKAVVKKGTATPTKPRRGRPPGSKNKPKVTARTASKSAPAKSTASRGTGKAKRQTAASSNGGRNMLGRVNYSQTDGWNPREGSAPDRIIKALKRFKGDRDKVFNFLKADVWDFCSRNMRDGTKRKLRGQAYGAEEMLRYRIARTDWDFAVRTGQHDPSEDRVEYGTGGTGEGIYKPVKAVTKKKAPVKSTTKRSTSTRASKTAPARRGRPPGSKNKPKVTAAAPKRRGRPVGSKTRARAKR